MASVIIIIALLLCLWLTLAPHDAVQVQQAATESYKSEHFKNDEAQIPVTREKQGFQTDSFIDGTAGGEKIDAHSTQDLGHSGEDMVTSSSYGQCEAEQPLKCQEETTKYLGKTTAHEEPRVENVEQDSEQVKESEFSGNIIQRSMQGLEVMVGQVEKSRVKVFEKLGGVMDQVGLSREHMLKRLDTVMDRVSESVSESKVRVIQGLDSLMDHVSASKTKMMEEIDHVIDKMAHSKVIEEIRALPEEIRGSFVLSVRNRSYIAAGVTVAVTTAILVAGAVYFAWCHQDAWSYHVVSPEPQGAYKDKDNVNSKDKNNVNAKCKDDVNSKDKNNVSSKDKSDVNSKDEDYVSSKVEDSVKFKNKDNESIHYEGDVKRCTSAQGLKNILNGHTAALGDFKQPDDDGKNLQAINSCQMVSGSLGTKDFDGQGNFSHGELKKVPLIGTDVCLQSGCPETAVKSEVQITQDDDVHEVQFKDITEVDIPHKCNWKVMPSQDKLQSSQTYEDEHQNNLPNTNDHHSVSFSEPLLSEDQFASLAFIDKSCVYKSSSFANASPVKPKDHMFVGAFSGFNPCDADNCDIMGEVSAVHQEFVSEENNKHQE